jgi:hypothetical protein
LRVFDLRAACLKSTRQPDQTRLIIVSLGGADEGCSWFNSIHPISYLHLKFLSQCRVVGAQFTLRSNSENDAGDHLQRGMRLAGAKELPAC